MDEEALSILLPIFEATPGNTRAALAIIRVHLRQGDSLDAEQVFRRAQKYVTPAMQSFLITADAEIKLSRNEPRSAVELLRPR
jgi:hypothetical protein